MAPKSEQIEKIDKQLLKAATGLDAEIRREWRASKNQFYKVAGLLNRMREDKLWTLLTNTETSQHFERFDDYVLAVTGNQIGHTTVFKMLAVDGLKQGPNALSEDDVEAMGPSKAAEIARLDVVDRTKEMVDAAKTDTLTTVRQKVQEKINEKLPPDERREPMVLWTRWYPAELVRRFEELETRTCAMEGVRDGDTTVSLRAKALLAWIYCFEINHVDELREADRYLAAINAASASARGHDAVVSANA